MHAGKNRYNTIVTVGFVLLAAAFSLAFVAFPPHAPARANEPKVVLEVTDTPGGTLDCRPAAKGGHVQGETAQDRASSADEQPVAGAGQLSEATGQPPEADGLAPAAPESDDAACPGDCAIAPAEPARYSSAELQSRGVINGGTYRYTWYSQRVLPGGGLAIEGRHVSDEGYVVDAQDRVVVASSDLPRGTEVDIPFGSGKAIVLDTGCASGTRDIYTNF